MNGGAGADVLYGGDGNDLLLDGDTSRDTIFGGKGNDTYSPSESLSNAASDVVYLDGGARLIWVI